MSSRGCLLTVLWSPYGRAVNWTTTKHHQIGKGTWTGHPQPSEQSTYVGLWPVESARMLGHTITALSWRVAQGLPGATSPWTLPIATGSKFWKPPSALSAKNCSTLLASLGTYQWSVGVAYCSRLIHRPILDILNSPTRMAIFVSSENCRLLAIARTSGCTDDITTQKMLLVIVVYHRSFLAMYSEHNTGIPE